MYLPKVSEIKDMINGLVEKFIINSQLEKANLIKDYIIRLETIFNTKNANMNYLYRFILIIIELARSPLMTSVNIDYLREKFEERHIRIDANRILKNKYFDLKDIKLETTVKYDYVNYASSESSDEEYSLKETETYTKFEIEQNKKNEDFENLKFRLKNKNYEIQNFQDNNLSNTCLNRNNLKGNFNNNEHLILDKKRKFVKNVDLDSNFEKDFKITTIDKFINKKPVYNKYHRFDLLNILIRDTKYSYLMENLNEINLNLNENNIELRKEVCTPTRAILKNFLVFDKQININSRLLFKDLEKNCKLLNKFYDRNLQSKNFQFKNSYAFTNHFCENHVKNDFELRKESAFNNLHVKFENNLKENFTNVDSQFILISALNNLISPQESQVNNNISFNEKNNRNSFLEKFRNFHCMDLDKNILNEIIQYLNRFNDKLLFLKNLNFLIKENNITSYIVFDLINLVGEFYKCMQFILNSYLKVALWQKGKLKNTLEIFLFETNFLFNQKFINFKEENKNYKKDLQINEHKIFEEITDSELFFITNYHYKDFQENDKSFIFNNNFFDSKCKDNTIKISDKEENDDLCYRFYKKLKNYLNNLKNQNLNLTRDNRKFFQRALEEFHNFNIIKYLDYEYLKNKNFFVNTNNEEKQFISFKKLTLLNLKDDLMNFYEEKIDYIISISENMLKIKLELDKINMYKPYLFIKEFIDFIYLSTKQIVFNQSKLKTLLATEIYFRVIFSYLEIIEAFILNGNLIDTFNEFFLDHIFTKKDNSKIIFNFNERFKKFDWFNSFKIKSYNLFEIEGGCVPEIFKSEQINFKILETGKSIFLIKNLRSLEKINFDLDIDMETIKMKEIKSSIYKEIHKILDIEGIINENFDFYEFLILKKFKDDSLSEKPFIKKDKIKFNKKNNSLEKKENENYIHSNLQKDKNKNEIKIFPSNSYKKRIKANNLFNIKKNIQVNSQIELQIYKILPYNLQNESSLEDAKNFRVNKNDDFSNFNKDSIDIINLKNADSDIRVDFNINFNETNKNNSESLRYIKNFNKEENLIYQGKLEYDFESESEMENNNDIKIINKIGYYNIKNQLSENIDIPNKIKRKEDKIKKPNESKTNISIPQKLNFIKTNNFCLKRMQNNKSNNKIMNEIGENLRSLDFYNLEEINSLEIFMKENMDNQGRNLKANDFIIHKNFNFNYFCFDLFDKTEKPINFSIDFIFKNNIIQRIKSINKTMNEKLLSYLINNEKIKEHFELCFAILFFRAGFSMNIFVTNLLHITQKGTISDNFFLKNLIQEISLNSDLKKFHNFIRDFFFISINKDMINNFDTFKIEYKPNLPISIFYDDTINTYYSTIFNYIFNIKRMNESFKLVM